MKRPLIGSYVYFTILWRHPESKRLWVKVIKINVIHASVFTPEKCFIRCFTRVACRGQYPEKTKATIEWSLSLSC